MYKPCFGELKNNVSYIYSPVYPVKHYITFIVIIYNYKYCDYDIPLRYISKISFVFLVLYFLEEDQ